MSDPTFFDFGRSWGPSKSTPTLQKWLFCLSESTILEKSCFFIQKSSFKKNMIFHHFWTLKNHPKIGFLRVAILEHWCFFRRRLPISPQDPPGTTLGSLLDHFWMTFGLLLDHFGIKIGVFFLFGTQSGQHIIFYVPTSVLVVVPLFKSKRPGGLREAIK